MKITLAQRFRDARETYERTGDFGAAVRAQRVTREELTGTWMRVRDGGVAHKVRWTDLHEVDFACGFGRYVKDCVPADPGDRRCRPCEDRA